MAHGERDVRLDDDPHELLFGSDEEDYGAGAYPQDGGYAPAYPQDGGPYSPRAAGATRSETRRQARDQAARRRMRRHGRRGLLALALVLVLAVAIALWVIARPLYNDRYNPKDYAGAGTGSVLVKVNQGDDANTIARTLVHAGVVASTRAFTNAAGKNSQGQMIQPGTYQLHQHMKASQAVALLLAPSSRVSLKVLVPEGATTMQIEKSLGQALKISPAAVKTAVTNVSALGLPTSYTVGGKPPTSVEGFLYPATYTFDPGTAPSDALSQMINAFVDQDRSTGFAQSAPKLGLSAYQELVVASMAQAEAKYPADMGKVARVIINRLAQHMPLKIDASTVYGAALQGADPSKVNFATYASPYNTYLHPGLPPTPISNPGAEALAAVAAAPAGDWRYYVNGSADGHLFFTNSETAFAAAQEKCYRNNWGCAAP